MPSPAPSRWAAARSSTARRGSSTPADRYVSATYDGVDYLVTLSYANRWERHGSVVLVFWLYGSWGHTGWSEPAPWAFQPADAAIDSAAATISPQIVQRLAATGAL